MESFNLFMPNMPKESQGHLNSIPFPHDHTSIFRHELNILREALESEMDSSKPGMGYHQLCEHYARLLRQSIKLTKMGDVNQRRLMKLKTELELQNAQIQAQKEALLELNRKLEDASLTDPLTQCRNRRFLHGAMDEFNAWVRRWQSSGKAFPCEREMLLMLVDIDHFKEVNDTFGHKSGDLVLAQMASLISSQCREGDWLIRWGGEEFLIVARETERSFGPRLAERLREAVHKSWFETGTGQKLQKTCSIGFTHYPFFFQDERWLDWELVLNLADQCLYAAKNTTRNAWVGLSACHEPPAPGALDHLATSLVSQGFARLHTAELDPSCLRWQ